MESEWRSHYVLAADERMLGRSSELQAAVRARELVRVSRGVYRHSWAIEKDADRRADDAYLARVRAAQVRTDERIVFAGMSAAAVWELPIIGEWPERVHGLTAPETGGRSNTHIARTYVGHPAPTVARGGLTVTALARTVADIARTESMERAVTMTDAALRGQTANGGRTMRRALGKSEIARELGVLGSVPGVARARGVLRFSDPLSASPGESCSRVGMWRLGIPRPVLQQAFFDARGKIGVVDFWWPGCNLVGEFDGRGKYLRDEYTRGRPTAQIVLDEKNREDRLRSLGVGVVRWDWPVALDLSLLASRLRAAGLR